MIASDDLSGFETAVKVLTAPVWVPIYLIAKACQHLTTKVEPDKVQPTEVEIIPPQPSWKPATELERAVAAAMILAGKPITNAELARLMGCSPGEASKRIAKMGAKVTKIRKGREVQISLPQYLH